MTTNLPAALDGAVHELPRTQRKVVVYTAGEGAPLLLIHSVNAVASAAEVRPLFDHYRGSRCVYALDLPGYGLSHREDRAYTVRVMTDALVKAAQWIQARHGGAPVDAIAVSLSCEFLARASVENPTLFKSLTLVSPTGFRGGKTLREDPGETLYMPILDKVLRGPGWGGFLFKQLTRPGVIRYFLERTWGGKAIDEKLWAYNIISARQPNAEFAPLAFLSGILFSADVQDVYQQVALPTLVIHGTKGDFTNYKMLNIVGGKPNWQVQVLETGAMPYFEVPKAYFAIQDGFLLGAAG
ncbi:alpha/beta fold hydrolase [Rhodoferax antarcticus]|uniref:Alpha/beta hydrolase fold family protein n=1 Tax=Rhodoferax antarcticus ANT.BR TaxID=1111071 RepID=A0A1Q8YK50_9BURK|nr:alpha/beta hydrolase [Rhodoferax antarcticus]APW47562.1 alpha/beta hydrolase [Rhodoferax antarcticus]MCW2311892.1 pimeloyl-ACP methyl ester carboxylesterase [Rhodoferax antarcticus]OLP08345.1 alpha/beta hydrolase fold family protein [Rhodoferax antarcticus ANT.BR]